MTKWTEDDIGKTVTITFEHGTEIEDTIVCVPLEMMALRTLPDGTQVPEMLGDGQPIIGPSIEVGMIHARLTHSLPLIKMQEERAKEMAEAIKKMEAEDGNKQPSSWNDLDDDPGLRDYFTLEELGMKTDFSMDNHDPNLDVRVVIDGKDAAGVSQEEEE